MLILLLLILGPAVGLISSFFGVGGGIIIVPTLYTLFPAMPAQMVIGISLGVICLNSLTNTINFIRLGQKPQLSLALGMGVAMALGASISGYIAMGLSPLVIRRIFGIIVIFVAIRTLMAPNPRIDGINWEPKLNTKKALTLFCLTFLGGIVSGLTGLGGGLIVVPVLIMVLEAPFRWVSAYSNPAMMVGTFVGALTLALGQTPNFQWPIDALQNFQFGFVNLGVSFIISLGAMTTSKWGAKLSSRIPNHISKRAFIVMLLFFGGRILLKTYIN